MKAIICVDENEFNAIDSIAVSWWNQVRPREKGQHWNNAIVHITLGTFAFIWDDRLKEILDAYKPRVEELSQDWFFNTSDLSITDSTVLYYKSDKGSYIPFEYSQIANIAMNVET